MQTTSRWFGACAALLLACAGTATEPSPPRAAAPSQDPLALALAGMRADPATAALATAQLVALGEDSLPGLKALRDDPDPIIRARAQDAMGQITGQWGGGEGLVWARSVEAASHRGKPILALHLFGDFDKEVC